MLYNDIYAGTAWCFIALQCDISIIYYLITNALHYAYTAYITVYIGVIEK